MGRRRDGRRESKEEGEMGWGRLKRGREGERGSGIDRKAGRERGKEEEGMR